MMERTVNRQVTVNVVDQYDHRCKSSLPNYFAIVHFVLPSVSTACVASNLVLMGFVVNLCFFGAPILTSDTSDISLLCCGIVAIGLKACSNNRITKLSLRLIN